MYKSFYFINTWTFNLYL